MNAILVDAANAQYESNNWHRFTCDQCCLRFIQLASDVYGVEFQQCNIIQQRHLALLDVIARDNKKT